MYSPTTRLLTVLEVLQSKPAVSGPELAKKLEVRVRSVRRYITMLRDMGIPVESEPGRYGNYYLRPGFRLPPLMFSNDEIMAVSLGLMLAGKVAATQSIGVESASAKIERVLPIELRQQVWALQETLVFNLDVRESAPSTAIVTAVTMAAHERKSLAIEYQSYTNEITERVIDPYGIAIHTGIWYAAGYCHLRHDLRTFRLDRMQSARLINETFERPKDFDVLGHVLDSIAQQPGSWTIEIRMRTSFEEARRVFPSYMALLEVDGEEVVMRCYTNQLDWMALWVLRIPCPFVIVQPVELRQLVREAAEKVIGMVGNTI
ncbi:MAG: YafY family transcriptional regulator [Anaerolineae bacterium]|nr:YafY family transcriptional regulator [Anaerolineae bacterium]